MKLKRVSTIIFAILHCLAPFVASTYFGYTRKDHAFVFMIHSILTIVLLRHVVSPFYKRSYGSFGVKDVAQAQVSCAFGFLSALTATYLLYAICGLNKVIPSAYGEELFTVVAVLLITVFFAASMHLKSFYEDLNAFVNKIRLMKREYSWGEACELSPLSMAVYESETVSASITRHGDINIKRHPHLGKRDIQEIEKELKLLFLWEPAGSTDNVTQLRKGPE